MSYEKQTWASGDVITAEKLNHIEGGVANNDDSAPLFVYFEGTVNNKVVTPTSKANYTRAEIINAIHVEKKPVIFGAYLTDASGYTFFYNMYPYTASEKDGEPYSVALSFVASIVNNMLYAIGADGTITVED